MDTLNDLGLKHKTDKAHTHFYMDNYEKYFSPLRDKPLVILELGIAGNASLLTWREYFHNSKVYGIDINPDCAQYEGAFIGSQTDLGFLQNVIDTIGIPDIIVDDGSHVGDDMVETFKFLFPKMKSDGIYCVEDFHCAFSEHYSGKFENNGRTKAYNFFTDLAYHVDVAGRGMCGNQDFCINHPSTDPPVPEFSTLLKSMHIYCSLRFFFRK